MPALWGMPIALVPVAAAAGAQPAAETSCAACGQRWVFSLGPANAAGARPFGADSAGWRRLSFYHRSQRESLALHDDLTCSGLWLAELFRGPKGWRMLQHVLVTNGVVPSRDTIRGVYSWAPLGPPLGSPSPLARPTLLVEAGSSPVLVLHQPPSGASWRPATAWYEACLRSASALGGGPPRVMLVCGAEPADAPPEGIRCVTWAALLQQLRELGVGPLLQARVEALEGRNAEAEPDLAQVLPAWIAHAFAGVTPEQANQAAVASASFVDGLLGNLLTLGRESWLVCEGCGATQDLQRLQFPAGHSPPRLRFATTRRAGRQDGAALYARAAEEPPAEPLALRRERAHLAFADLLAEWVACGPLASALLTRIGANVGAVSLALCWPRLRLHPREPRGDQSDGVITPDAVLIGSDGLALFVAKAPVDREPLDDQTCASWLLHAAHAHALAEARSDGSSAHVVLIGRDRADPALVADRMHALFLACGEQVPPRAAQASTSYPPGHPFCRLLRERGPGLLRAMLVGLSWRELAEHVEQAAASLAERTPPLAPAFEAIGRRARGFWPQRA